MTQSSSSPGQPSRAEQLLALIHAAVLGVFGVITKKVQLHNYVLHVLIYANFLELRYT